MWKRRNNKGSVRIEYEKDWIIRELLVWNIMGSVRMEYEMDGIISEVLGWNMKGME